MEALLALDRERFDTELLRRGLTARQLARTSGVHETAISNYRRGKRKLRAPTLRKLALTLKAYPIIPGSELLVPEEAQATAEGGGG